MNDPLVSIIVPVYNVENFIEKCATTLFEQDYDNIEYIFVNDCTPDGSIGVLKKIIEKYPNRKNSIKIINKEKNEGLPQARKTGLENSNGEYIMHVDSDDWVELDMVSSLVKEAIKTDADIVICDYYVNYKDKEKYCSQDINLYNLDKYLMDCFVLKTQKVSIWSKFCKRNVYQNIEFPTFSNAEDFFIHIQIFYHYFNDIHYLNKAFLHYNKTNENSITYKTVSDKKIKELYYFDKQIQIFLKENDIYDKFIEYHYIGLLHRAIAITGGKYNNILNGIAPEANKLRYIWKNYSFNFYKKILYTFCFFNINIIFMYNILKNMKANFILFLKNNV